jgi:hypothetical protein
MSYCLSVTAYLALLVWHCLSGTACLALLVWHCLSGTAHNSTESSTPSIRAGPLAGERLVKACPQDSPAMWTISDNYPEAVKEPFPCNYLGYLI